MHLSAAFEGQAQSPTVNNIGPMSSCIGTLQCTSISPQKCPLHWGDQNPRLMHGSLDSHESAANGISVGSAIFTQLTRLPNKQTYTQTDRHTDHATCDICNNMPHLMHCMQTLQSNKTEFVINWHKRLISSRSLWSNQVQQDWERWLASQKKINQPRTGLTVDSSLLTFLPSSKSRDTKAWINMKKSGPIKFRYCTLVLVSCQLPL